MLKEPSGTFAQIAAGNTHACALTAAGRAVCWGSSKAGL